MSLSHQRKWVLHTGSKYPNDCGSRLGKSARCAHVGGGLSEVELKVFGEEREESDDREEEEEGGAQVEHPDLVRDESLRHGHQLRQPLSRGLGDVLGLLGLQLLGVAT